MLFLLFTAFVCDVISDEVYSEIERSEPLTLPFYVDAIGVFFSIITDQTLIALLWIYFIYFFRKKKEFLSKSGGQFTTKEKTFVILLGLILTSNSINIAIYNIMNCVQLFTDIEKHLY